MRGELTLNTPIQGILFDKDGTLLDFHAMWIPAYRRAAAAVSEVCARPDLAPRLLAKAGYETATGRCAPTSLLACGSNAEIAALWARELGGADAAQIEVCLAAIFFSETAVRPVPVTDLPALFGRLISEGYVLGVATMDSEACARETLRQLEAAPLLAFICGADSGFGCKPERGMVDAFAARVDLRAEQLAVVGDTPHDLNMGRNAGVGCTIGVLGGTSPRAQLEPLADIVIDNLEELERALDEISASSGLGLRVSTRNSKLETRN